MNHVEFLESSSFLSSAQKKMFLNSSFLGVKWQEFWDLYTDLVEIKNSKSDFNNEVLRLIVEKAGDWHDCLPYAPESFDKLTSEEKDDLNAHLDYVWKVINHFIFRTSSLWGE